MAIRAIDSCLLTPCMSTPDSTAVIILLHLYLVGHML